MSNRPIRCWSYLVLHEDVVPVVARPLALPRHTLVVPILILNSEQDGHVGSQGARRALDDWSCSSQEVQDDGAEGSRSTRREAVWYDIKAWCGEGANPGHKWYANALACEQGEGAGRRQYAALKDDILSRIAAFL